VRLSIVPFLYSKRTAAARPLVSLIEKRTFCRRSRADQPWNYPGALGAARGSICEKRHNLSDPGLHHTYGSPGDVKRLCA
jgi:hypothetical protein